MRKTVPRSSPTSQRHRGVRSKSIGTIRSMQRTYGQLPEPRRIEALGDSIVAP